MGWFKKLDRLTKDSISDATAVFAVLGTLATIIGISLQQVIPGTLSLWALLVIVLAAYVLLVAAIRFMKHRLVKDGITLKICGNSIIVKRGDLFSCSGWKVIPFNEYYDTKVDDVVISKASLNGIFIERYTNDIEKLKFAITTDSASTLPPPVKTEEGRMKYELGTIKRFDGQYLVLAFTHFNDLNEAHLTMPNAYVEGNSTGLCWEAGLYTVARERDNAVRRFWREDISGLIEVLSLYFESLKTQLLGTNHICSNGEVP